MHHSGFEKIIWHARSLDDLLASQLVIAIKQGENGSLEDVDNELMPLVVLSLEADHLDLTIAEEPGHLTVAILLLIPHFEAFRAGLELGRKHTSGLRHGRPRTTGEDLEFLVNAAKLSLVD